MKRQFARGAISLGSNLGSALGNSRETVNKALEILGKIQEIELTQRSSLYQTTPVGPPQPDYVNACAILTVELSPLALLDTLLAIEAQFGRVRRERWQARTLDLDLLLYQDLILDSPRLTIPHPRMRERGFVLVPLAEIVPDWQEPITGKSIAQLAKEIDTQGVIKLEI
jgi:2-amino-4-hydroxy-6-hydroxymethyldihydropteridine diphosphokinase